MKNFIIFFAIPLTLILGLGVFTAAMGLIREASDISVIFGVTLLGGLALGIISLTKLYIKKLK